MTLLRILSVGGEDSKSVTASARTAEQADDKPGADQPVHTGAAEAAAEVVTGE